MCRTVFLLLLCLFVLLPSALCVPAASYQSEHVRPVPHVQHTTQAQKQQEMDQTQVNQNDDLRMQRHGFNHPLFSYPLHRMRDIHHRMNHMMQSMLWSSPFASPFFDDPFNFDPLDWAPDFEHEHHILPAGKQGEQQQSSDQLIKQQTDNSVAVAEESKPLTATFSVTGDEKNYIIKGNLPHWRPDEIKINIDNHRLVIEGEHKEEREESNKESANEADVRSSMHQYSYFRRSWKLPLLSDSHAVSASYKDGQLEILIPKLSMDEKKEVRQIPIQGHQLKDELRR